jgi:hypothetical protein
MPKELHSTRPESVLFKESKHVDCSWPLWWADPNQIVTILSHLSTAFYEADEYCKHGELKIQVLNAKYHPAFCSLEH